MNILPQRLLLLVIVLLPLAALPAHGESWRADPVDVPGGPVIAIRDAADGALIRTGDRWVAAVPCSDALLCFSPAKRPYRKPAPAGGLPDGFVAMQQADAGIVEAWYETPTRVYRHGILGDATEAATLAIRTRAGRRLTIDAGEGHVFEDLTPRLADLDGDGRNEVIVVRTDVRRGAAVAVYGLVSNRLRLIAATEPVGRANRWRNPALTVADPSGRGRLIAEVVTPHIGGTLNLWQLKGSAEGGYRLARRASARGFSNHAIGSRELGLMVDGGSGLIAVPSGDRLSLRILQVGKSGFAEQGSVRLPGRIDKALAIARGPTGPIIIAGLEDGRLFAVHRSGP